MIADAADFLDCESHTASASPISSARGSCPVPLMLVARITTRSVHLTAACALLASCASYSAQPLALQAALAPNMAALDRTRSGAAPIPADRRLTLAEVAILAVRNSPDLRAVRAQGGVAQAQVIEAGLLPDPVLSGSYGVLMGGPGIANAIGATLTANNSALITLSARRRAAEAAAMQVDANVVWQEWQTISRAQTLAIDLVEQDRLISRLGATLALLRTRGDTATRAVHPGQRHPADLGALRSGADCPANGTRHRGAGSGAALAAA